MLGPIDYIAVGFAGNNFKGDVLEALADAVDKGIIRVIDLLFIMKDREGNVIEGEFEDQSDDIQQMLAGLRYVESENLALLGRSDIDKLGEQMPVDSAAGVLVIEHLWAKSVKKALIEADGFLIADGRIHPEKVEAAVRDQEVAEP